MKNYIQKILEVMHAHPFERSANIIGATLVLVVALSIGTVQPIVFAKEAPDVVATLQLEEEILWFARTIYSETKREEEQLLVAWVVRNRVESERFPDTYKEVVLQRGQFSGLHPSDKQYRVNMSFTLEHTGPGWDSAVEIARAVHNARGILRPLSKDVLHFYSPQSVRVHPSWAAEEKLVRTIKNDDSTAIRFAFYEAI